jgi:hypothetical protein
MNSAFVGLLSNNRADLCQYLALTPFPLLDAFPSSLSAGKAQFQDEHGT